MRRGFLRKYDAGANHMVLCRMYVESASGELFRAGIVESSLVSERSGRAFAIFL